MTKGFQCDVCKVFVQSDRGENKASLKFVEYLYRVGDIYIHLDLCKGCSPRIRDALARVINALSKNQCPEILERLTKKEEDREE